MKKFLTVCLLFFGLSCYAQEFINKVYYFPDEKLKQLKSEVTVLFEDAPEAEKKKAEKMYVRGTTIFFEEEIKLNGKTIRVKREQVIDDEFFKKLKITYAKPIDTDRIKGLRGVVLFEDDKLLFNPIYLKVANDSVYRDSETLQSDTPTLYSLSLKNNGHIWIPFTEFNVTSLTIPLKYRFRSRERGVEEEFTSGINLNFLLGFSYGETKFIHRQKVGNKANTWKLTLGGIIGTSTVSLDSNNTSAAGADALPAGESITKGLFSMGIGATYSYNKINVGLFYGWDNSVGRNAEIWNYNGRPWIGFGVGYSLFKL